MAAERALAWSREVSVLVPVARVYLATGQEAKAIKLAQELGQRLQPDPQSCGKLSYKTFLAIKEKAEPDPMVSDARGRLAGK